MAFHREGVRETRKTRSSSSQVGATTSATIIFSLWLLLILSYLSMSLAVHEEASKLVKSLPRKAKFFHSLESFPPAQSPAQVVLNEGDPNKVYEDDKRIIHTGPNPLHN